MERAARAVVNLDALRHNLQRVREAAPGSRIVAALKANAYGHGLIPVARALHSADMLAVAFVEEALSLREAGIETPVLALQGVASSEQLRLAAAHNIQICLQWEHQLCLLEHTRLKRPVSVWLKIDTGMHRLGIAPSRVPQVYAGLRACASVQGLPRLMTHLARADERHSDMTRQQIQCFDEAVSGLDGEQSIANSAGILGWLESRRDWVRPGIMLYGASPFEDSLGVEEGLRAVMSLQAPLLGIKQLKQGDAVGYGATWVCPQDMPVGYIAIGYGDGYPRHAPQGTPVLVSGRCAPLVGRVSMDVIAVDLRGIQARVGEPVLLWGEGLAVERVARSADTISYELLCAVGACARTYTQDAT